MKIRSKVFRAVVAFDHDCRKFAIGDQVSVEDPALPQLIRFGVVAEEVNPKKEADHG